ncbi:MAG: hypothetical protein KAT15_23185, partial [Bacteroidales bacterium]|nr:hypothetical protein [Bacteroidales bacterium]
SLKANFSKDIEGMDAVAFFGCHPTKVRAEQFWDFNFYQGANPGPDELQAPDLRPAESMVTARNNFRRLMQFLKSQDNIEITTYGDLMDRFSYQREFIRKKDLRKIAAEIVTTGSVVIDEYYSPAEVFAALAQSISQYAEHEKLPGKLERASPLGPMEMPPVDPELSSLTFDQVSEIAEIALSTIKKKGYLPARLSIEGKQIGTGSLLALLCSAYLDLLSGDQKDAYEVIAFEPYPKENEEAIVSEVEGYKYWIVHRPDLDMARLVEFTRLQLWTMKPARERE